MEKKALERIGVGMLAAFGTFVVFSIFVTVIAVLASLGSLSSGSINRYMDRMTLWIPLITQAAVLAGLGVLWLILRPLPVETPRKRRLSGKQILIFACICLATNRVFFSLSMGMLNLAKLLLTGSGTTVFSGSANAQTDFEPNQIPMLLYTCVGAPIFEELMFRKVLLDRLRPFGDKVAILYTALAFGLFHENFSQFFHAAALGLILGYLVLKSGNVWYGVLMHAIVNCTATLEGYVNGWGVPVIDVVFYALLLGAACAGLVLFFRQIRTIQIDPPRYRFSEPLKAGTVFGNGGAIVFTVLTGAATLIMALAQVINIGILS